MFLLQKSNFMNKENSLSLIKGLLNKLFGEDMEVSVTEKEDGSSVCFDVNIKNSHQFLNREGEALSALNHLSRKILEKLHPREENDKTNHFEIMIDVNGFHKKKVENLKNIVHMMAERARYFKSSIELDPMNAYERRVVHEFLSDATDLKTESQGIGPSRRVVIKYIGSI